MVTLLALRLFADWRENREQRTEYRKLSSVFCILFSVLCLLFSENIMAEEGVIRILAMGDSTTAGTPFFRSPVEAPPDGSGDKEAPYTHWLGDGREDRMVFNRGVAGERTDEIFERMKKDVPVLKPHVVIILAGVNDLYQGHSTIRVENRLEEMYQFTADNKLLTIACSILPYNTDSSDTTREKIAQVNRWIRTYSEKHAIFFCDTAQAVETPGQPGRLSSTQDGLHPDKAGYQKMGERVKTILEESLNSFNYK